MAPQKEEALLRLFTSSVSEIGRRPPFRGSEIKGYATNGTIKRKRRCRVSFFLWCHREIIAVIYVRGFFINN